MGIFNKKESAFEKRTQDKDFYSETIAATVSKPSRIATGLLWGIAVFLVVLIVSSIFIARNTEVIATGQVTPSLQVRKIESLEQGIVKRIIVRENEHVNVGEPLLRLSFNSRQSELAEAVSRQYTLLIKVYRLISLLDETEFTLPEHLKKEAPAAYANEKSVYEVTLESFNAEKDVFISRYNQQTAEKQATLAEKSKAIDTLKLAIEDKDIIEPLVKRKAQPEIKLYQKQRDVLRAESDLKVIEATVPQIDAAVEQAKAELDETIMKQKSLLSDELTKTMAEVAELVKRVEGLQEIMTRRDIIAPVSGVVQKLYVTSVGNVALAGEPLVDLIPDEDSTLVSVHINPKDRGQVQECLWTDINITAFNVDKYGMVQGWVEKISPDSLKDERGRVFFEADIRSNSTEITQEKTGKTDPISVGMNAKVFIKTGERKVLGYILKPFAKNLKSWNNEMEALNSGLFNNECIKKRGFNNLDTLRSGQ